MGLTTKEFISKAIDLGFEVKEYKSDKNPNEIEVGYYFENYSDWLELVILEDKEDVNKDKRKISRESVEISLEKEENIQLLKLVLEYKKD